MEVGDGTLEVGGGLRGKDESKVGPGQGVGTLGDVDGL